MNTHTYIWFLLSMSFHARCSPFNCLRSEPDYPFSSPVGTLTREWWMPPWSFTPHPHLLNQLFFFMLRSLGSSPLFWARSTVDGRSQACLYFLSLFFSSLAHQMVIHLKRVDGGKIWTLRLSSHSCALTPQDHDALWGWGVVPPSKTNP